MNYALTFGGQVQISPISGGGGSPFVSDPIDEALTLTGRSVVTVVLSDDNPKSVAFGDIASARVVMIRVVSGGKVRARYTSADGSSQSKPVDPFDFCMSRSVPFTAIDLTRVSGNPSTVTVEVILGQ